MKKQQKRKKNTSEKLKNQPTGSTTFNYSVCMSDPKKILLPNTTIHNLTIAPPSITCGATLQPFCTSVGGGGGWIVLMIVLSVVDFLECCFGFCWGSILLIESVVIVVAVDVLIKT